MPLFSSLACPISPLHLTPALGSKWSLPVHFLLIVFYLSLLLLCYQHRGQFLGEIPLTSGRSELVLQALSYGPRGLIPTHDVLASRSQPKYATQP